MENINSKQELQRLIESSVRNIIKEYADTEKGQAALGKAAKRAALKGDDSVYHDAIKTINRNKFNSADDAKNAHSKFQKSFEECGELEEEEVVSDSPANDVVGEARAYKVNEEQLRGILRESIYRSLNTIFRNH